MTIPFHAGELAVQRRAGVQTGAARIGGSIRPMIPPAAQAFLRLQPLVVVASADQAGQVWASLLTGEPGFARALDERHVAIAAVPLPGDPLGDQAAIDERIGLLAIDFAHRKRMRINGRIVARPDGGFVIETEQVYANCPKYIQARALQILGASRETPCVVRRADRLSEEQRAWIGGADTFFIASAHPSAGIDASHRGGNPGFVQALDAIRLVFPDFAGNTMFQTLGNLEVNPRAGLLFLDFERGSTLQVTGQARVHWDEERAAEFAGAERLVEFAIDMAIEVAGGSPFSGHLLEYSPFNPA